jgi:multidrug transporter EmrE-like cation transporter
MIFAITSIILNAIAQILMKKIANGGLNLSLIIRSPFTYLLLASYATSIVFWMFALRKINVSIAYPMQSLGYVLVTIVAFLLLQERISNINVIGLVLIVSGSIFLAVGR